MILERAEIYKLPRRYRANLMNSILGYKPANLIGTANKSGNPNLAIFSSAFHLGANPALIGMISRPDTVARHTLENIRETNHFTINHVSEELYRAAHQTSAKYPDEVSEFEEVGLTSQYLQNFTAPFVQESQVKIGLGLREINPIKLNGNYLIIGEVLHLLIEEGKVLDDGSLNFDQLQTVSVTGLDTYHKCQQLEKLEYARP